jgi:molybdopterin/thiamine biosynthesis adenylyltransferase
MDRSKYLSKLLTPHLHEKLSNTSVLCVGAGGIGCELLKNLVMSGFGNITIVSGYGYDDDGRSEGVLERMNHFSP